MSKVLLIVIAFLAGCAHTPPPKTPTCMEVLDQQLQKCQPLGQQSVVAVDGLGLVVAAVCPDSKHEPILVTIGITESPSLVAAAIKDGAKDIGWCALGTVLRRVVRFEAPMPDMRASN